ncbi:hypothetical protein FRC18_004466 [Serendipita sp. 400]|nr:hypothetical protein FRC18_004466 [Serendipita sp. 400]
MPKSQIGSMTSSGQMDVNSDSDESTRSNYRTVDICGIGALDLHSQFEIISGLTYHDLSVQISRLVSNETLVALVPIFGPYPVFRYPHDGEAISPSARKIYLVDKKEDPSVVVVRTRDEDIPISVSLSAEDDQSLLEPVITRGISVHGYSPISIKDYLGISDISNRNVARANFMPLGNFEFRSRFREDALAHKQLQFLFSRGEGLVRKASCTEDYALQLIHLTRSLLHLIVSAQEMVWNNGSSQRLDYYLDLHRLADGLETCIKTQSSSEQHLESYFSGLCGDYFGAVAVRQSHDIFSCLMGACSVIHNPSTTLIQRRDALSHSSGTEHTSVHESASPSIGEKVQDFFEIARKDVHNVAVLLAEEFPKLGLKDGDPAPGERAVEKDGPRAGEVDTRKSLEDQSRKGRDTKARQISLGLPWAKEKAPDDLPISDTLRDPLRPAKIVVPLTKAEEKKKEEENKSEESDSDMYLSPEEKEVTDPLDDATPHRKRWPGRKSLVAPYPSTSRAPSRLPSNDWHPTANPTITPTPQAPGPSSHMTAPSTTVPASTTSRVQSTRPAPAMGAPSGARSSYSLHTQAVGRTSQQSLQIPGGLVEGNSHVHRQRQQQRQLQHQPQPQQAQPQPPRNANAHPAPIKNEPEDQHMSFGEDEWSTDWPTIWQGRILSPPKGPVTTVSQSRGKSNAPPQSRFDVYEVHKKLNGTTASPEEILVFKQRVRTLELDDELLQLVMDHSGNCFESQTMLIDKLEALKAKGVVLSFWIRLSAKKVGASDRVNAALEHKFHCTIENCKKEPSESLQNACQHLTGSHWKLKLYQCGKCSNSWPYARNASKHQKYSYCWVGLPPLSKTITPTPQAPGPASHMTAPSTTVPESTTSRVQSRRPAPATEAPSGARPSGSLHTQAVGHTSQRSLQIPGGLVDGNSHVHRQRQQQ